jgi:hypothetical protein
MAKAEPVAWLIKGRRGFVVQLKEPHPSYACMSTPLYTSPDATRIAALEAENAALFKQANDMSWQVDQSGQMMETLEADAARWREVAEELAKMLELSRATCLMDCGPVLAESWSDPRIEAALVRFKQESDQ